MITIYGRVYSRAARVLWAAEEIGLSYQHVSVDHKTDAIRDPAFIAVNPNGKIPALIDGDVHLFESMAINIYLAMKYGKELLPDGDIQRALALQWSFWGMSEIEPNLISLFVELVRKPLAERSQANINAARSDLNRMLSVLETALQNREYLLEERFTIADLNLASILALHQSIGEAVADIFESYPNINAWFSERCTSRAAFRKVMAMEKPPADLPHLTTATSA